MLRLILKFCTGTIFTLGITGLGCCLFSMPLSALTLVYQPIWAVGSTGIAGTCYYNLPDLAPLSVPRTLVVDNHLPVGVELFHWGYSEFAPNINAYCDYGGIGKGSETRFFTRLVGAGDLPDANGAFKTSIPGIGIRYYFTYTSKGSSAYSSAIGTTSLVSNTGYLSSSVPLNVEYQLNFLSLGALFQTDFNYPHDMYSRHFSRQANHVSYSIRAVLVKTGSVTYTSTPLSLLYSPDFTYTNHGIGWGVPMVTQPLPNLIGGGGITIIPPACRLKTPTDYVIDMRQWVSVGSGSLHPGVSLPAYGHTIPVNITLECSGKVDNVYFRFEDPGTSPLANKNVSLYDSGGAKIDGLEVEMRYGGNRINVDGATKTNIGVQGSLKTDPEDIAFNSQSTASFSARYVQRGAIKKGGLNYTGPVTGKVNMYVTYQ